MHLRRSHGAASSVSDGQSRMGSPIDAIGGSGVLRMITVLAVVYRPGTDVGAVSPAIAAAFWNSHGPAMIV